ARGGSRRRRGRDRASSGAVALLELLAGAAGTQVVAAHVLELAVHLRVLRDRSRDSTCAREAGPSGRGAAGAEDRLRARELWMLVAQVAVRAVPALLLELGRLLRAHLRMEEERDHLFAD